jgi:DNA-binding transcriptional regulator YiaG
LQWHVAEQLGVALATYRNWETFDVTPSNEKKALLMLFLGYDPFSKVN